MKKNKVFLLVVLFLIGIIGAFTISRPNTNNIGHIDGEIQNTVDKFINLAFTDSKKASDMTLGVVKFNLVNMKEVKGYRIIDTDTELIESSENFFRVYKKVEYENSIIGHDVIFYCIDFIKHEGSWKVISLVEIDPIVKNFNNEKISDLEKKNIMAVFQDYIKEMNTDYESSEKYLISKAKRTHKTLYNFNNFENQAIKANIKNINIDKVIYHSKDIAIAKLSYDNNSKERAVLLYLYRTSKGWKIYDIKQI